MIAIQTILLPTDGSECSGKAMTYALSFAKQYGARVVALHVIDQRWEEQTRVAFAEVGQDMTKKIRNGYEMGTHGRSGVSHLLLGSVAEKVVRRAPCPVLTVRQEEHDFVTP